MGHPESMKIAIPRKNADLSAFLSGYSYFLDFYLFLNQKLQMKYNDIQSNDSSIKTVSTTLHFPHPHTEN